MSVETKNNISPDIHSIPEMVDNCNYAKLLGLKVTKISKGRARVSMKIKKELLNPLNSPHGGAIISLADHACGTAALTLGQCVGSQFSVNIITAPKTGEEIVAEAWVINNGRRTRTIEVEVKDQDDRLVAKGLAVAIVPSV